MTKHSNRKAKVTAYATEHGLTYQQALQKLNEADQSIAPKQPVKARIVKAGCSWWIEITAARYWQTDNAGVYGYRPFPLWPDTVPLDPARLDKALAGHGWERHVEEWPTELAGDAAVFLRRTPDGHAEDRAREDKMRADGKWECPAGLCGEYEDETECDCDGISFCWDCNSSGMVERPVEHCCYCGGSPYCQCCKICSVSCIGDCRCPIGVYLQDGRLVTL
ncbi:hypothetical protein AB0F17_34935 [Nonomuraea sp. NPDC026600]|uniref:hypothetical protein n=1 Tax=Nonomuraea sp. NPDC026600 TaxID=3155363 RepID=UPI0033EF34CD